MNDCKVHVSPYLSSSNLDRFVINYWCEAHVILVVRPYYCKLSTLNQSLSVHHANYLAYALLSLSVLLCCYNSNFSICLPYRYLCQSCQALLHG